MSSLSKVAGWRVPICMAMSVAALVQVPVVRADDAPANDGWKGKGQVGVVVSQGNSESKSANAAIDTALVAGQWKHAFHLAGLYGESAGIVSAQRWDTAWQTDYQFTSKLFGYGAVRYARDMFSGFQYQAAATAGVGYKFIDSEAVKLTGQLGAGYRKSRPELIVRDPNTNLVIGRVPLDTVGDAVYTAGLDYAHILSSSTVLTNKLYVEYGASNTLTTDTLALTVKMSDALALSVGVSVIHNSDPPGNLKTTDTVETVNLVFAF
jgi:putative salt-induced outer membrane protein